MNSRRVAWEDFQSAFPDQDWSDVLDDEAIAELMDTSSVTVEVRGRRFIIEVQATEI